MVPRTQALPFCTRAKRSGTKVVSLEVCRFRKFASRGKPSGFRRTRSIPVLSENRVRAEIIDVFSGSRQAASMMPPALSALLTALRSLFGGRATLHAEVLALPPSAPRPQPPARSKTRWLSGLRSGALVLAIAPLAGMAPSARRRPAGDRDPLAPPRVSSVLAVEESFATPGAASDRSRAA